MSKRDPLLLLEDILEAIAKIESYTNGLAFEDFTSDCKSVDAVIRNLEIIGEAAKQLPDQWRDKHTDIKWHKLAGIRNRIIHEYFGIDLSIIWEVVQKNMPELRIDIIKLLK